MQKINYNELFKNIVKKLDYRPRLLLHTCCSPCLIGSIDKLVDYFDVTIFYYNPNLINKEEYDLRLLEIHRLIEYYNYKVNVVSVDYENKEFFDKVKGYENLGERSQRCVRCFDLRLEKSAIYAKENNFDYFTTTLTISPMKDTNKINELMQDLEKKYDVKHLPSDFKKENGLLNSISRSKELSLYRQDYCGCVFSYNKK